MASYTESTAVLPNGAEKEGAMPQIAITNTFWEGVDGLDRSARARVDKAMAEFQQLMVLQLQAVKGLQLEFW